MKKESSIFFSKYLSIWVAVCIILGTAIGYIFPGFADTLGEIEIANVSIPVAIVLLIMMYPIMLKINFEEILNIEANLKPLLLTLVINWAIKLLQWHLLHGFSCACFSNP